MLQRLWMRMVCRWWCTMGVQTHFRIEKLKKSEPVEVAFNNEYELDADSAQKMD